VHFLADSVIINNTGAININIVVVFSDIITTFIFQNSFAKATLSLAFRKIAKLQVPFQLHVGNALGAAFIRAFNFQIVQIVL